MGTLFIVSTPIGNLQDISFRALKTLFESDVIACEDTRRAGILLNFLRPLYLELFDSNLSVKPRLISYYDQVEMQKIPELLNLLFSGKNVALISDAGTPAISDPGYKLIRESLNSGVKVESIPGPSSVLAALTSSGLPTDKFIFLGYPPHKPGHRHKLFESLKNIQEYIKSTVIFFISPHKLVKTLNDLKETFGDMEIVLIRELTKIHEERRREKISSSIIHFEKKEPKGEFVLLFNLSNQENS